MTKMSSQMPTTTVCKLCHRKWQLSLLSRHLSHLTLLRDLLCRKYNRWKITWLTPTKLWSLKVASQCNQQWTNLRLRIVKIDLALAQSSKLTRSTTSLLVWTLKISSSSQSSKKWRLWAHQNLVSEMRHRYQRCKCRMKTICMCRRLWKDLDRVHTCQSIRRHRVV